MRLLVTIESAAGGTRHDVVLTYAPETRVRDLAAALTTSHAGAAERSMPTNVVALPGATAVPTLTGPVTLYLGEEALDPDQRLNDGPVRHGAVLGLGAPSSQRLREPAGLVEVRISSGPGAGHVHRLGIGRATVGPGRHCTIRLPSLAEDPDLAGVWARLGRRWCWRWPPTAPSPSSPTPASRAWRCRSPCAASR